MGKISIQELATVLAENSSLNKKESLAFVTTMFDIIQEALERDRNVKIKGLGTFKIIDVEDRESVNVNTGERVLIEGHGKITFTPDPLMKELVNKPFSQFETVVLNDGVEFGETPEEVVEVSAMMPDLGAKSEEEPEPEVAIEPEVESEPEVAPEPEVVPEPEPEPEVEASAIPLVDFGQSNDESEETDEDIPEWVIEPAPESIEETPKEEPIVEEESTEEPPVEETPVKEEPDEDIPEWVIEPMPTTEEPVEEESQEDTADEEPQEEPAEDEPIEEKFDEEVPSSSKKWIWAALLALLLGLAGGYVLGNYFPFSIFQSLQSPKSAEVKEAPAPVVKESPKAEKVEKTEAENPQSEAEQKAEPETKPEAKPEVKEVKPEPQPEKKSEVSTGEDIHAVYAAKDVRVRTGAYRIIGTKKVVKAKEGETLLTISKRNLGPGMECYVEAYNDIKASTVLKEGQEIKIPDLKWKVKKKAE